MTDRFTLFNVIALGCIDLEVCVVGLIERIVQLALFCVFVFVLIEFRRLIHSYQFMEYEGFLDQFNFKTP